MKWVVSSSEATHFAYMWQTTPAKMSYEGIFLTLVLAFPKKLPHIGEITFPAIHKRNSTDSHKN